MSTFVGDLQIKWFGRIVVVTLPEEYWIGTWGEMLELVRKNLVQGATDIVVDFSKVVSIGDGSAETYILRDEFKRTGGHDVYHIGMSDRIEQLYNWALEDYKDERIKEFTTLEDALEFIRSKSTHHS